jgi:membrane-bound lytic murein transglycosylase MltF
MPRISSDLIRAASLLLTATAIGLSPATCRADADATRLSAHIGKKALGDLDRVVKARYLRVLTTKNPYDYFVNHGEMKGVQYEMAREFVAELNRKYVKPGELKIAFEMIPLDFDQLMPMLNAGKGDIIAVGMTRTSQRDSRAAFTVPYQYADDVIVTRAELASQPWRGKTFAVQKGSSYLEALSRGGKAEVRIQEAPANLNAENMMELVSLKGADYTLVNSYWAAKLSKRFSNLAVLNEKPFRKRVAIRWAVRKRSPRLLRELNAFIPKVRNGTLLGNTFGHKYFDDLSRLNSIYFDTAAQRISQYDAPLKKYAKEFGFDWRLLDAQCLQESRFDQGIVNPWGAIGLFQIKQATADEPYVDVGPIRGAENFDNNIHAGVKYLAWLKKSFFDSQKDLADEEKLRMMLAAYNAGPTRVQEAIAKAKEMGLDPNLWFRNVELAMLELGAPEPVIYVSEINKHYVGYVLMGIQ